MASSRQSSCCSGRITPLQEVVGSKPSASTVSLTQIPVLVAEPTGDAIWTLDGRRRIPLATRIEELTPLPGTAKAAKTARPLKAPGRHLGCTDGVRQGDDDRSVGSGRAAPCPHPISR